LNGYKRSLAQHGLPFKPDYVLNGAYTYDSGLEAAQALHRLAGGPTAIFASNDLMAIGCIVGLRELGYQIPADMSVMGIDDITSAQFVVPSLTTMALSLYDLGKVGMESLIGLRSGEKSVEDVITLPHRLVVRQSTGSPQRTSATHTVPGAR
jgi:DNA-binding LacI/PurR family transcriptional regulator